MCSLTRLYVWVDTAIYVSWYSHMCRLIRIYSLKSDAYRVKKRWWQLVRAPRLRSLAFIAREPCRKKEGISIKKIPFIALSWHPRFLFYPFELSLSSINIGWAIGRHGRGRGVQAGEGAHIDPHELAVLTFHAKLEAQDLNPPPTLSSHTYPYILPNPDPSRFK